MSEEWKITDTPPPLHNLMWSEFPKEHEDYVDDPVVRIARDAHSGMEQAWMHTLDGHRKALVDPNYTEDANISRSHEAAMRRKEKAADNAARASGAIEKELAAIDASMNQVPKAPPPHVVQMIKDDFKAMSDNERHNALVEAIKDNDMDTIGAVLFVGPAYLYGLNKNKRELMREQYRSKAYPNHVARKAAILSARTILEGGAGAYERSVGKLFDTKRIEKTRKLGDEARKALE